MKDNFLTKKIITFAGFFLAIVFSLFSLLSFVTIDFDTASSESQLESCNEFIEELNALYQNFGLVQHGEEYVIDKDDVQVEDGEEYVSASLLSANTITTFSATETQLVALSSLEERYTITEDDDSYTISENDTTNRIIVYYEGSLDAYNTEYYVEWLGYHIYQYETPEDTEDAYLYYSSLSYVERVSYDYVITTESLTSSVTTTSSEYLSWGASVTGVDDFITYLDYIYDNDESKLETVYVAVLDTGINTGHELFEGRISYEYSKDFTGTTSKTGYNFEDDNGHGSKTSGIIVDQTKSNVQIIALKVLDEEGSGTFSSVVAAINYVISLNKDQGSDVEVRVMNMSLGYQSTDGSVVHYTELENLIRTAYNNGVSQGDNISIMSVIAAGNGSANTVTSSPSNVSEAIVVSAIDQNMNFANYSNYGSTIDFCAPGTSILSATIDETTRKADGSTKTETNRYVTDSGTSFAAPHVTAVIALLLSSEYYAAYSNAELISALQSEAIDLGDEGYDIEYGYGCINISAFGTSTIGEITFSVEEENHTESFSLELSYSYGDGTCTIYYTTDETNPTLNSSVYTGPLTISKTTQIRAMAVYKNNSGLLIKSEITVKTYYFNNIDLDSSFEVSGNLFGGTIEKYNGNLTTLNIQGTIGNVKITAISAFAFSNTTVENVILPSSCTIINSYAFYNATNLKTVTGTESVTRIGNYAFANCLNLESLEFKNIEYIYQNAFNNVTLTTLTLGGKLKSFGEMSNFRVYTLECYTGSNFDDLFEEYAVKLVSINPTLTADSSATRVITTTGSVTLSYKAYGKYLNSSTYGNGNGKTWQLTDSSNKSYGNVSCVVDDSSFDGEYVVSLTFNITGLSNVGNYTFTFSVSDEFDNTSDTLSVTVLVIPSTTDCYELQIEGEHINVYVDGELVTGNTYTIYSSVEYNIVVVAEDSYELSSKVSVDNIEQDSTTFTLENFSGDVIISATATAISNFNLNFIYSENVTVLVGEEEVDSNLNVDRNSTVTVTLNVKEGYEIYKVLVNGELVTLDENNSFVLENILQDYTISVYDSIQTFIINITYGNGGYVSASGIYSVEYGTSETIEIVPEENYEIDYVTVNGERVSITDNTLTLENITSDMNIVITFVEIGSLTENQLTLLIMFLIVLGIAFIWGVVEIALKVQKNKKYNYKKNYTKHF